MKCFPDRAGQGSSSHAVKNGLRYRYYVSRPLITGVRAERERDHETNYLAPDIVVAILNGRQPAGLTASQLISDSRLPLEWSAQRAALGISLKRDPRKYSG